MTGEEARVRAAVRRIVDRGEYPSCGAVERELEAPVRHNLNGRKQRARAAALLELGWKRAGGPGAIWKAPI